MAYISVSVELDEFSDDDLLEELESRGYSCSKDASDAAVGFNFERIEHLAICGQKEAAKKELISMLGSTGRIIFQ